MSLPPPYEDNLTGACVRLEGTTALVTGEGWEAASQAGGEVLLSGELALRYAFPLLHERGEAIVPQLVFDDHRREHTGRALYRFVMRSGLAYPRADVEGVRVSGEAAAALLRDLDLAAPLVALVTSREEKDASPARVQVAVMGRADSSGWEAIEPEQAGSLPDLLAQSVPCYRAHPAQVENLAELLRIAQDSLA